MIRQSLPLRRIIYVFDRSLKSFPAGAEPG
jgi:hypothetical protein